MARFGSSAVKIVRLPMTKPPRGLRLVPSGALGGGFRAKAKRSYHRARAFALSNKSITFPVLGAAGLGLMQRTGIDLPFEIPMVGQAGTVAIALYAIGHFAKSQNLKLLAIGPACIAVHGLASGGVVSGFDRG